MTRVPLDDRLRRILTFVVESHVSRAEPVGSQFVRAAYHLSISPATIRGAMQELEGLGLLDHPHTSAGRVPTEAGYRLYVDELMRPEPLRPSTRRTVGEELTPLAESGDFFSPVVPRVLARSLRQLAMVALKTTEERPADRADFAVRIDGADHIAAQPEFQSPDRMRPLVRLMAEREGLAEALEAFAERGCVRVSIGRENGPGAMREYSLVGMRLEARGRTGLLGVMGPVRMPYRRAVSLVAYVGGRISGRA
jgi:transcriptional regulator of heat shock response